MNRLWFERITNSSSPEQITERRIVGIGGTRITVVTSVA